MIFSTYCFSTLTMVARKRPNDILFLTLSVLSLLACGR